MHHNASTPVRTLVLILLLAWLAGCASPSQPSRFYRLESASPPVAMPQSGLTAQPLPIVGIGPVDLAGYLDRPQIVERTAPYRLTLHEYDRWAGPLQENSVQVLSEAVQTALAARAQVLGYPWHGSVRPDYEVLLTIHRFERQGQEVRLDARWTLVAQPQGRLARLGRQSFRAPIEGEGVAASVAAASNALNQLADTLADELAPLLAARH